MSKYPKEHEKDHIGVGETSGNTRDRRKLRRTGFALKRPPKCIIQTSAEKLVFATPEEADEYRKAAGLPAGWRAEEVSAPEEN